MAKAIARVIWTRKRNCQAHAKRPLPEFGGHSNLMVKHMQNPTRTQRWPNSSVKLTPKAALLVPSMLRSPAQLT